MDDKHGWMRATFKTPCDLSEVQPTSEWITNLLRQNPDLTGWPFFVDLWTPTEPEYKPKIKDGIWEAKLVRAAFHFDGIDHWRIDAKRGLFYAARVLEDDTYKNSENPGKTLDFVLAILRAAEILTIAVHFVSYLCKVQCDTDAKIALTFEWTGLKDRYISSWTTPGRSVGAYRQCHTDTVKKYIEIPIESSNDQIVLFTYDIVSELFLNFDGWECPSAVVKDLVSKLLNRTL